MLTSAKGIMAAVAIFSGLIAACSSQSGLEWHEEEGYRWAEADPGYFGDTGFEQRAASETGIRFGNEVSRELIGENRHYLNGSGVAAADVDGDELVDIYFASLEGPNKLYKNFGDYHFEDITKEAGVAHEGYRSTGVVFADVDGDADPDLLITSLTEQNVLYLNDGDGNFRVKKESGLGESRGAETMTLADINGDGLLDLYIANYKPRSVKNIFDPNELTVENTLETVDGEMRVIPPYDEHYSVIRMEGKPIRVEDGEKDELYINKGEGTFEKTDDLERFFDEDGNPSGLSRDWGLTATFRDANGDRHPDLYVANDFWTPDRFWINRGDGTFKAIGKNVIRNMSFSAMGVDFSDIDRDGDLDFMVTEMLSREHQRRMRQTSQGLEDSKGRELNNRNSLFLNRGDSTYAQIAHFSGLHASEWSWSTHFLDVDLNGYEDLLVATGYSYDYLDMDTQFLLNEQNNRGLLKEGSDIFEYPSLRVNNKLFRNNGDLTFTDRSREWGFDVDDISLGVALADLDNDGDLDVIINRFNEVAALYENRSPAPRIAVRLAGNAPNTRGIGAKITLQGGPVIQSREMTSGGNYLSGSQPMVVFAADAGNADHTITVDWPGGKSSSITGIRPDRVYEIRESTATADKAEDSPGKNSRDDHATPLFEEVSVRLNHEHHAGAPVGSGIQPLLPQKMSRQGPGVAWLDFDGNGTDDLFITSGEGGRMALFQNDGAGRFRSYRLEPLTDEAEWDQAGLVSWREGDYTYVVTGNAHYRQTGSNVPSAFLYLIDGEGAVQKVTIPGITSSTGPLAAADVDGNGYMDLFVGGRFQPGQYPGNADSRLFNSEDGRFSLDAGNTNTFFRLGLVTGAVFSDYNQDGQPDLVVSNEWGTLRLYENNNGQFREVTEESGLGSHKGWWRGVATGDFNNDGLPDLVATNIGLNSPYQLNASDGHPLKLFYGDLNRDGSLSIVDAYYDEQTEGYVPRRRLHDFGSVPTILNQVKTHREFAASSADDIFGVNFKDYPYKEINTLEHRVFINTGNGFTSHPLPRQAQFTAASYVGVADFDNDGNEDLFLGQNYFALPDFIPRLDAGRGLVLKGDGRGHFSPLSGSESGIKIYGEQRGAALSDFNRDGKVELAVSQHNEETKLYLNRIDKSGVRVHLIGPENNTNAIGSSIRIVYEDGNKGPRREIQAGSGYWSQNSSVQVMGVAGIPERIEITWFDGTSTSVPVEDGKMTYRITR